MFVNEDACRVARALGRSPEEVVAIEVRLYRLAVMSVHFESQVRSLLGEIEGLVDRGQDLSITGSGERAWASIRVGFLDRQWRLLHHLRALEKMVGFELDEGIVRGIEVAISSVGYPVCLGGRGEISVPKEVG